MALPFILVGIAAASGITGLVKGVQGVGKNMEASGISHEAGSILSDAQESLKLAREATANRLASLGRIRVRAWDQDMNRFVTTFGRLKNVELADGVAKDEFARHLISDETLADITRQALNATTLVAGGLGALGSGALIAYGSYGGAMAFGAASTGTAISSLSGVAATNATLAWFGGGSLAAGGYGIAGGTLVLGGLVAGPAILVGGFVLSAAAEKKLANARANRAKAWEAAETMTNAEAGLQAVDKVVNLFMRQIRRYRMALGEALDKLDDVLTSSGDDYAAFDAAQRRTVWEAVEIARVMRVMLSLPVLDEDGGIHPAALGIKNPEDLLEAPKHEPQEA